MMTRKRRSKKKLNTAAHRDVVGVKSLRIKIDNSPTDIIEDVKQSSQCSRSMSVSTYHSTEAELLNCARAVDKTSEDTPVFKVD